MEDTNRSRTQMNHELYMQAYMDGYIAGLEKAKAEQQKPYIDKDALIERYDGKIGENKALEILRNVRHVCNGGRLDHKSLVLTAELVYWESIVDKRFKERL